jgi:hypothetical protein
MIPVNLIGFEVEFSLGHFVEYIGQTMYNCEARTGME